MCPTTTGENDPLINPFVDGAQGLEALACGRVLVCIGEGDVLRDRGSLYYNRLRVIGWSGEAETWQASGKGHTLHLLEPVWDEAVAHDRSSASSLIVDSSPSSEEKMQVQLQHILVLGK
jgi:acetyl esterase/lipase